MNKEEIRLIKGYFNDGYCCDLDELKDIANKMINENQQLKKQKDDVAEYLKERIIYDPLCNMEVETYISPKKILRMLGEIE